MRPRRGFIAASGRASSGSSRCPRSRRRCRRPASRCGRCVRRPATSGTSSSCSGSRSSRATSSRSSAGSPLPPVTGARPRPGGAVPVALVAPDVFAYVGIHLRYDTTWYVLTDRSLRIRRGILTIHETTISFENVQNVEVRRAGAALLRDRRRPGDDRRRRCGLARARRQTSSLGAHKGILQGLDDAEAVRNQILPPASTDAIGGARRRAYQKHLPPRRGSGRGPASRERHVSVLREIRDSVRRLAPS